MFWPFHKWPFSPPPYGPLVGGSGWNAPVQLRNLPIDLLRSHTHPREPHQFAQGVANYQAGVSPNGAFFLPNKASTAYSGRAFAAATAVGQSEHRIAELARRALIKNAAGVAVSYEEAQALFQVKLPPVVQLQTRAAVGAAVANAPHADFIPPGAGQYGGRIPASARAITALEVARVEASRAGGAGAYRLALLERMKNALMFPVIKELRRRG
jgi:hypothetical protein